MQTTTPRYSDEEFRTRGEAIFVRDIEPHIRSENPRDFVLIDIETGDYEVDADAQVWMRRVGSPYGYYVGFRPLRQTS
jgi:hypothetical protein